jgi:hypothetical protein
MEGSILAKLYEAARVSRSNSPLRSRRRKLPRKPEVWLPLVAGHPLTKLTKPLLSVLSIPGPPESVLRIRQMKDQAEVIDRVIAPFLTDEYGESKPLGRGSTIDE